MWQAKTVCPCKGEQHKDLVENVVPVIWTCKCVAIEKLWRQFSEFTIPEEAMDKCTLYNFDSAREPDMYRAASEWVQLVLVGGTDWLCMTGTNGTGKSHLLISAIKKLVSYHSQAVAISAATMYDRLEHLNFAHGVDHGPLEARLIDCPVLAIDDVGARKLDERLAATMFRIIDGRSMKKRATLLTTDKELGDVESVPGWKRIVDRIYEHGLVVSAKGTSYRYELAKKRTQQFKDQASKQ